MKNHKKKQQKSHKRKQHKLHRCPKDIRKQSPREEEKVQNKNKLTFDAGRDVQNQDK